MAWLDKDTVREWSKDLSGHLLTFMAGSHGWKERQLAPHRIGDHLWRHLVVTTGAKVLLASSE